MSRPGGFGRRVVVRVCRWVWMVVRFVCVIRVSACALVCPVCVSRLPPRPRCLFTGACPVCVPAPPGVFLPVPEPNYTRYLRARAAHFALRLGPVQACCSACAGGPRLEVRCQRSSLQLHQRQQEAHQLLRRSPPEAQESSHRNQTTCQISSTLPIRMRRVSLTRSRRLSPSQSTT